MTDSDPGASGLAAAVIERDLATRTDPRVARWLAGASRFIGLVIVLLGLVVIVGWISGVTALTTIWPSFTNMKFNTAIGLTLLGVGLVSLGYARRPALVRIGRVAAAGSGLVGLLTLVEYLTGRQLGIDNPFRFGDVSPTTGRMAEPTAVCLLAMAVSVLALGWRLATTGSARRSGGGGGGISGDRRLRLRCRRAVHGWRVLAHGAAHRGLRLLSPAWLLCAPAPTRGSSLSSPRTAPAA